ncbi:MAG: response regulator [Leptospiraceae bacterium]|nr:response regulator [Leptospiraceae bacterium]
MSAPYRNAPEILCVDDTAGILHLLESLLSKEGYHVSCAASGDEAVQRAEETTPDLILLDVTMPGMDGFETCRRLKSIIALRETPVIFLTSRTESDDVVRGFEVGAVDYVFKPFQKPELLSRIRTHVELRRAREEYRKDLQLAARLQRSIFNGQDQFFNGVQISLNYLPWSSVGGDMYDISMLTDDVIRIFLADAIGHGIRAALASMLIKSEYDKWKCEPDMRRVLHAINEHFYTYYREPAEFFPAILVDINHKSKSIEYISAGHVQQFYLNHEGMRTLEPTGGLVGVDLQTTFTIRELPYDPAARLILFTDGLVDQTDDEMQSFGHERIQSVLAERGHGETSIQDTCEAILNAVRSFAGNPGPPPSASDDITLLGVQLMSPTPDS